MKVIGREEEQEIFSKAMRSEKSEFIAVIGRRRVGKTFLIRKFFGKDIVLEFTGIYDGTLADHKDRFEKAHLTYFGKSAGKVKNWFAIFDAIEIAIDSIQKKKKKVIFLDELPWMGGSNSQFIKALSAFWNSWASKREDIIIVVSGSSTSWMVKKIFDDKGGLHNRITQRMHLLPFTLKETEQFLKYKKCNLEKSTIAEIYMCIGGIPFYQEMIEPNQSVAQIIDSLFFRTTASLKAEFSELFNSQFDDSQLHINIATILAKHNYGLERNQLLQLSKLESGGNFTKALGELQKAGFITAYIPFGNINKGAKYKLTDLFSLFYLRFVSINPKVKQWRKIFNTPSYHTWTGFAFENMCLQHTEQIKKTLKIDGINTNIGSWHHKGNDEMHGGQIDLLIDRDDKVITVCELKYYNAKLILTKDMNQKMRNRMASFKHFSQTTKSIFPAIITPHGVHNNKYTNELTQSIVTLENLF
jgi:uncharacterized protein